MVSMREEIQSLLTDKYFHFAEEKKMKEKKKICKACNKGCKGGYAKAEPELVKIDRIKLKKVPMPVEVKSYKKMAKGGKGGFKVVNTAIRGGYSFPEPVVSAEPEILALPEPETFTKKQLVTYDYQYQQYPDQQQYQGDYYDDGYDDYSMMPNMTDMMTTTTTTTTTTTPAPARLLAGPQFVTFNPVAFGKKR